MRFLALLIALISFGSIALSQSEAGSFRNTKVQTDTIKSFSGLGSPSFPLGFTADKPSSISDGDQDVSVTAFTGNAGVFSTVDGVNAIVGVSGNAATEIASGQTNTGDAWGGIFSVSRTNGGDAGTQNIMGGIKSNITTGASGSEVTNFVYGISVFNDIETGVIDKLADFQSSTTGGGGGGVINTHYGLLLQNGGFDASTEWGVYEEVSHKNYFAGQVGIAKTPSYPLDVSGTINESYDANGSDIIAGVQVNTNQESDMDGTTNSTGMTVVATKNIAVPGSTDLGFAKGMHIEAAEVDPGSNFSGTFTAIEALSVISSPSTAVQKQIAVKASVAEGGGTTTDAYDLYLSNTATGGGAYTNLYGLYLADDGAIATNTWGIYQANAGYNYFAGKIGIRGSGGENFRIGTGSPVITIAPDMVVSGPTEFLGNVGFDSYIEMYSSISATNQPSGSDVFNTEVAGGGGFNYELDNTGKSSWSDGAGGSPDVNLYRFGAGVLKTDNSLAVAGHFLPTGSAPGLNPIDPCVTGYTLTNATDISGKITMDTDGSCGSGTVMSINFAHSYDISPNCVYSPADAQTGPNTITGNVWLNATTSELDINFGTTPIVPLFFTWVYHCDGFQ